MLYVGFAFGGSCLPKDLRALTNIAKQNDIELPMLSSLLHSNRVHIEHAVDKILALGRPKVGMLGLSFKAGTDDLRESPLVMVAKRLIGEGCELRIFDPEVQLSRLLGANRIVALWRPGRSGQFWPMALKDLPLES